MMQLKRILRMRNNAYAPFGAMKTTLISCFLPAEICGAFWVTMIIPLTEVCELRQMGASWKDIAEERDRRRRQHRYENNKEFKKRVDDGFKRLCRNQRS